MFFFSSRRRHTRLQGDWSSDVCSSDLHGRAIGEIQQVEAAAQVVQQIVVRRQAHVRSEERRVGKSVDLGGRRIIKKKKTEFVCSTLVDKLVNRIASITSHIRQLTSNPV